jgi:hypothetical protein
MAEDGRRRMQSHLRSLVTTEPTSGISSPPNYDIAGAGASDCVMAI